MWLYVYINHITHYLEVWMMCSREIFIFNHTYTFYQQALGALSLSLPLSLSLSHTHTYIVTMLRRVNGIHYSAVRIFLETPW